MHPTTTPDHETPSPTTAALLFRVARAITNAPTNGDEDACRAQRGAELCFTITCARPRGPELVDLAGHLAALSAQVLDFGTLARARERAVAATELVECTREVLALSLVLP